MYEIILTEIPVIESRMRTYLEIHCILAWVLDAPLHNKSVILKAVCSLKAERIRIDLE